MTRLWTSVRWDITLQMRHGFYSVYAIVTTLYVLLLWQLPAASVPWLLTLTVFSDPAILGFYFIGGLILLEKAERTLDGIVVTPLRTWEYIASKVVSLALLATVVVLVLALVIKPTTTDYALLVLGTILTAVFNTLIGFVAVAHCRTLNQYILSAMVYFVPLNLPVMSYLGLFDTPLFWLLPARASLLLIGGAFQPIAAWQIGYAVLLLLAWSIGAAVLARRAFYRHIVLKAA
jgi:fluoroquinolone transport system permease protein